MSIIYNNPNLEGASGRCGGVVYKRWRGRTIMANRPRKRKKSTEKQKDQQDNFRMAVRFAKQACAIPEYKAIYAKGINDQKHSANAVALSDFLNSPEIRDIDVLTYSGAPGELIRVRAFDDFKVKAVSITITSADGTLIEKGEALPRGKRGLWRMTTTVRNTNAPGTVFSVVAKDFAGNETHKTATIPMAGQQIKADGNDVQTPSVSTDKADMWPFNKKKKKPAEGKIVTPRKQRAGLDPLMDPQSPLSPLHPVNLLIPDDRKAGAYHPRHYDSGGHHHGSGAFHSDPSSFDSDSSFEWSGDGGPD